MKVIPFPYATGVHRLAAVVAQHRNIESHWRPLPGQWVEETRYGRRVRLEACCGHPSRPLYWSVFDPAIDGTFLRLPAELRPLPPERIPA